MQPTPKPDTRYPPHGGQLDTYLTHLECSACTKHHSPRQLINLCDCGMPLLARYDLPAIRATLKREDLGGRGKSMWRYRELLPAAASAVVTLGEGITPLLPARRLGEELGLPNLWIKDESANPTGSFKARGMAAAVTMARLLGARKLAAPSAGNAAGRWRPTPRRLAWRRTSSCLATSLRRTVRSAS